MTNKLEVNISHKFAVPGTQNLVSRTFGLHVLARGLDVKPMCVCVPAPTCTGAITATMWASHITLDQTTGRSRLQGRGPVSKTGQKLPVAAAA